MKLLDHLHQKTRNITLLLACIILTSDIQIIGQENPFPYKLELKKDLMIGGGGILIMGIGGLVPTQNQKDNLEYFNKLNKSDINGFDRIATENWNTSSENLRNNLKWGSLFACLTVVPAISGFSQKEQTGNKKLKNALTVAAMGVEGYSYVLGLTMISKNLISRNRPYAYNNNVSYTDKIAESEYKESFFSGTTATTSFAVFFSAKIINDLYPNSKWRYLGWAGAFAYTSYVGYLAIDAGQHFPTDVVTGAVIGGTIGYLIPQLHKKNNFNISLQPNINNLGLHFSMNF